MEITTTAAIRLAGPLSQAPCQTEKYVEVIEYIVLFLFLSSCVKADKHARKWTNHRMPGASAAPAAGTPLALLLEPTISEGDMQIGVETSRSVENKRIFVVDDDEIIRAALQFMLHDENETHEAPSLEWAYDKAVDWPPDLVILAETILRKHGVEVIGEIKEKIPAAKILAVVDSITDSFGRTCLAAGAHNVIAKPLKIEFVRQKVDVLLGRRNGAANPAAASNAP